MSGNGRRLADGSLDRNRLGAQCAAHSGNSSPPFMGFVTVTSFISAVQDRALLAAGWEHLTVLLNHTTNERGTEPARGMDAPERKKDNTERRETAAETIARQEAELRECLRADKEKEMERQRVRDEEERARQAQGELDMGLRRLNEEAPVARRARLAAAYERPATDLAATASSSTSSSSSTTNNSVPPYERKKAQPTAAAAPRNAQPRPQAASRQLPPNRVAARTSSSIGSSYLPPPQSMHSCPSTSTSLLQ